MSCPFDQSSSPWPIGQVVLTRPGTLVGSTASALLESELGGDEHTTGTLESENNITVPLSDTSLHVKALTSGKMVETPPK